VQQRVAPPVGRRVHVVTDQRDIAERAADVFAQCFVMVAGDQVDMNMVTGPFQEFLHHRVVLGRPVEAAAHCPEIDDVAQQENVR
jgi:hypothetical protein